MDSNSANALLQKVRTRATEASDLHAVLHAAYDAVVQGNFDAFGESLTDDVELSICGFGLIDGTWRGRQAVVAAARANYAQISQQQPQIEAMIRQGDSLAVLLLESGVFKATGEAYSVRAVQWFTFENRKIKKIDEVVASI